MAISYSYSYSYSYSFIDFNNGSVTTTFSILFDTSDDGLIRSRNM
jgi:hypothetical protein